LTTDATHTITLTADGDNRHYGIPAAVSSSTTRAARTLQLMEDYATVE
jgi:hypothetical protein